MKCPTCDSEIQAPHYRVDGASPWRWCSNCGTLVGEISNHVPKMAPRPGLLIIAAEAVNRANKKLLGFPADELGQSGVRETIEDITEAVSAIIHELEARSDDGRELTAAERADARGQLAKVITAGMDAVLRERERCAKIADEYTNPDTARKFTIDDGELGTSRAILLARSIAQAIRKVPR